MVLLSRAIGRTTGWAMRFRAPAISMATESTTSLSGPTTAMMAETVPERPILVYGKAGTQFGAAVETAGVMRQVVDTTNLAAADGFILQGDASGDRFGFSVAGAGDINGDRIDDLIVGAYWGDDGGVLAGEAYIVYGKTGDGSQFGMAVRVSADGEMTLSLTASDAVGSVVRQVLDTSMLAPRRWFQSSRAMWRKTSWVLRSREPAISMATGWPTSSSGPIFGDDDGGSNAGEAYIVYGKAGTDGTQFGTAVTDTDSGAMRQVLDTTDLAPAAGFILQGDVREGELGFSVSGAGDINGDGFDDLIVGARDGDDGGDAAGGGLYHLRQSRHGRHAVRNRSDNGGSDAASGGHSGSRPHRWFHPPGRCRRGPVGLVSFGSRRCQWRRAGRPHCRSPAWR